MDARHRDSSHHADGAKLAAAPRSSLVRKRRQTQASGPGAGGRRRAAQFKQRAPAGCCGHKPGPAHGCREWQAQHGHEPSAHAKSSPFRVEFAGPCRRAMTLLPRRLAEGDSDDTSGREMVTVDDLTSAHLLTPRQDPCAAPCRPLRRSLATSCKKFRSDRNFCSLDISDIVCSLDGVPKKVSPRSTGWT